MVEEDFCLLLVQLILLLILIRLNREIKRKKETISRGTKKIEAKGERRRFMSLACPARTAPVINTTE